MRTSWTLVRRAGLPLVFLGALQSCGAPAPSGLELTLANIHQQSGGAFDVAVAPDGSSVAVVGDGPDGRGIYRVATPDDLGEGTPAASAVFWSEGASPVWDPVGRTLAYIREGALWVAPVDSPAEARRLTGELPGVRNPAFAPDGERIAFYSSESGTQDIWIVPSDGSGAPEQLTRSAMSLDDTRFEPAWSPDGRMIAFVSNAADYWHDDVWVVEVATGATRQLTSSLMASSSPVWAPEGDRLVLFATAKSGYWYQDLADIYEVSVARPGSEQPIEMQVHASDAAMRHRPFFSDDGSTIYFPFVERGEWDVWAVPTGGGVATRVTTLGGSLRSFHMAGDRIVVSRQGPTEGSEAWTIPARGGEVRRITSFAPAWSGLEPPREVFYRSFDGLYIQGYLYLPDGLEGGRTCPALVQVHGGGTNTYSNGLNLTEQYLASQGYVVFAINYRGGSGFGRAFQDLAVGDWMGDQALDAGAAADFLRTLPYVNGRVGIYGGSYGGAMSLAAVTLTPEKFDAAVPTRGAYSEEGRFDETDRLGQIFTRTGHRGLPEENPGAYETSNSIARLSRLQAPVLLMHGEEDRRVPFVHHQVAVAELTRLGKEFEEKSYPGEGHGFRDPANRIDLDERRVEFFRRHLGACGPS